MTAFRAFRARIASRKLRCWSNTTSPSRATFPLCTTGKAGAGSVPPCCCWSRTDNYPRSNLAILREQQSSHTSTSVTAGQPASHSHPHAMRSPGRWLTVAKFRSRPCDIIRASPNRKSVVTPRARGAGRRREPTRRDGSAPKFGSG